MAGNANDEAPIVHVPNGKEIQLQKKPIKSNKIGVAGITSEEDDASEEPESNKIKLNKYQETREKVARFLDVTLLISNASTLANVYKNRKFYRNQYDVYSLVAVFGVSITLQSIAAVTFMIVKYYTDQMDRLQKAQNAYTSFKNGAKISDIPQADMFEIDGIGRWSFSQVYTDHEKVFHEMEALSYKNYRRRRFFKHIGYVCVFVVLILNILGGAFFNVLDTVDL